MRVIHTVIPWTIPDDSLATAAGPGGADSAGRRAAPGAGAGRAAARALRVAAALLGLAVIGGYLGIALARLGYPFPLEVLESNSLVEVHRILAGQPLYAAPTVSYVPDGYPPLYFAVSAAAASVLGQSYLALRLVSLVSSLACFAIVARLVQRETASAAAGLAAAGLLAATYFATGTWFDVARVDSLFLALSVAGLYAARWMRRPARSDPGWPAARRRVPHQADRAGRGRRRPRRRRGRAAPAARRPRRAGLRRRLGRAARSRWGWPAMAGTSTTSSSR